MFEPASQDASVSGGPAQNNEDAGSQGVDKSSNSGELVRKSLNNKATVDAFRALSARLNGIGAPVNGHFPTDTSNQQQAPIATTDSAPMSEFETDGQSVDPLEAQEPQVAQFSDVIASADTIPNLEITSQAFEDQVQDNFLASQPVERPVDTQTVVPVVSDVPAAGAQEQNQEAVESVDQSGVPHPTTIEEILGYTPEPTETAPTEISNETAEVASGRPEIGPTPETTLGAQELDGVFERQELVEDVSKDTSNTLAENNAHADEQHELSTLDSLASENILGEAIVEQLPATDENGERRALDEADERANGYEPSADGLAQSELLEVQEQFAVTSPDAGDPAAHDAPAAAQPAQWESEQGYEVGLIGAAGHGQIDNGEDNDDFEVVLLASEIQSSSPERAERDLPAQLLERIFDNTQEIAQQPEPETSVLAAQDGEVEETRTAQNAVAPQIATKLSEATDNRLEGEDATRADMRVNREDADTSAVELDVPPVHETYAPLQGPTRPAAQPQFDQEAMAGEEVPATEEANAEHLTSSQVVGSENDSKIPATDAAPMVEDKVDAALRSASEAPQSEVTDSGRDITSVVDDRCDAVQTEQSLDEIALQQFDQSELEIGGLLRALSSDPEELEEAPEPPSPNPQQHDAPDASSDSELEEAATASSEQVETEPVSIPAESAGEDAQSTAVEICDAMQDENYEAPVDDGPNDTERTANRVHPTTDVNEIVSSIAEKFSGHPRLASNLESTTKNDASVVANEAGLDDGPEFDESKTDAKAGETARMLLDIMSKPSGAAQPQERALAADTLLRLVAKIPAESLVGISERICIMEAPPSLLVNKLIRHPNAKVAGPLLETCNVISDQVLLPVIAMGDHEKQRMIARRRSLTPALCDALLEHGDASVFLTIVRNPGAAISHDAFITLSEMAKSQPSLQAPLVTRGDTPPPTAFELFWFLPSELRRYVLSRYLTDSETLDKILKIALAVDGTSKSASADEAKFPDKRLVEELIELIKDGPAKEAAAKLSKLAGISSSNAHRILSDPDGEPLAVAMKAIGCSRSAFSEAVISWQKSENCLLQASRAVGELQNLFDSLSFNKARVLLTYWDWASSGIGPYARKAA
jgi:uncharacterized protein (DUF2336 family)